MYFLAREIIFKPAPFCPTPQAVDFTALWKQAWQEAPAGFSKKSQREIEQAVF
jgi:hypothetical protein